MALLLGLVGQASLADTPQDKAAQLDKLRETIRQLRDSLETVRTRYDRLRSELRRIEQRIDGLRRSIEGLDHQLLEQGKKLHALQRRRSQLHTDLAEQRRILGQQLRTSYAIGRQEYLKLLLNQEDPAALGRVLKYYEYFHRDRAAQIDQLKTKLSQLVEIQLAIRDESRTLAELRAEQLSEKQALETTQRQRSRLVAQLQQEIQNKDQQLARLIEDEKRLNQLVTSLHETLSDIPSSADSAEPFRQLRGKLSWPVRGRLSASYGSQRKVGGLRWRGVMIDAQRGSPVRAIAHGRVAYADWLRGYGQLIILDHGDGYMSLYGHNQRLHKETGEWVARGESIAQVGNSGGREHSGLYFEIRRHGRPRDPVAWCRGRPRR